MKARPKHKPRVPSYRLHAPTNQAFVELSGKRHYLGKHGTRESKTKYKALVAEWLANDRRLPVPPDDTTVVELLAAFVKHAETYYRKHDGTPSAEVRNFKLLAKLLTDLYGETRAADFGPRALQTIRAQMIAGETVPAAPEPAVAGGEKERPRRPWSRGNVNQMVGRVKAIFKWGVSQEMVPGATYQALAAVAGLRRGRCEARETEAVGPAPIEHVEAIKKLVSRQVEALIDLQLLTGARAGELCMMRPCDLDITGKVVWEYRPQVHKTAYRGHERIVYLGPRARGIVEKFLQGRTKVDAYLFDPREAEAERRAKLAAERKTPLSCGNVPGSNRKAKPEVEPGERYDTASYRRAIARACRLAGVPTWHPHQLRHNAATMIRRDHGLEAAQLLLGHSSALVTEAVYAERDRAKAIAVAERVG